MKKVLYLKIVLEWSWHSSEQSDSVMIGLKLGGGGFSSVGLLSGLFSRHHGSALMMINLGYWCNTSAEPRSIEAQETVVSLPSVLPWHFISGNFLKSFSDSSFRIRRRLRSRTAASWWKRPTTPRTTTPWWSHSTGRTSLVSGSSSGTWPKWKSWTKVRQLILTWAVVAAQQYKCWLTNLKGRVLT